MGELASLWTSSEGLSAGDPAPWFQSGPDGDPGFRLHTLGGRYVALCFLRSAGEAAGHEALEAVLQNPDLFNGVLAAFCGVICRPRGSQRRPVSRGVLHDGGDYADRSQRAISQLYGPFSSKASGEPCRRLLVRARCNASDHQGHAIRWIDQPTAEVIGYLRSLPPPYAFAGFQVPAPILIMPNVFEAKLCRELVELHQRTGGSELGVMKVIDGKTQLVQTEGKKRRDITVGDPALRLIMHGRIARRVLPEIRRAFQFNVTRIHRFVVGCYAAEDGGLFGAHRDNTTPLTAHRRFAVSVMLSDGFEGGGVSFPEYGPREYTAPLGGAVVFSCSLLHAVSPVTQGKRYVFLTISL